MSSLFCQVHLDKTIDTDSRFLATEISDAQYRTLKNATKTSVSDVRDASVFEETPSSISLPAG
jgi:hypothetical protein